MSSPSNSELRKLVESIGRGGGQVEPAGTGIVKSAGDIVEEEDEQWNDAVGVYTYISAVELVKQSAVSNQSSVLKVIFLKENQQTKLIRQRFALALKIQQDGGGQVEPAGTGIVKSAGDIFEEEDEQWNDAVGVYTYISAVEPVKQSAVSNQSSVLKVIFLKENQQTSCTSRSAKRKMTSANSVDGLATMTSSVTSSESAVGSRHSTKKIWSQQRFALALKIQQDGFCEDNQQRVYIREELKEEDDDRSAVAEIR
ncbi:hypothetical protein F511_25749 [Dorcoceras hygrometricum]|uniref:Uncharacterized protein n=1 Tax=Dorcoceras hygrometricum TaxID=472368 RepID=A0A2Z7B1U9_9LAMI|nr:hypothetical protein F511_25749 [Dorcoceras hygrometricum]